MDTHSEPDEVDSRLGKRRRTDSGNTMLIMSNATFNFTKHPRLWIEDGNIIIVAPDGTAYRLHIGFLSLRSNVFKDLFSAAHTLADEKYEGCGVVRLPDPPVDIRAFFEALYHGRYVTCSLFSARATQVLKLL